MARGVKPKPRMQPREPLPAAAPRGLTARARKIYAELAADLIAEGYACRADARTVALTADVAAHAERLASEVEALDGLVMHTAKGSRVHPLVSELRAVRGQLAGLYGQLFLSPRSRSSSRLSESQARAAAGRANGKLAEFLDG